MNQLAPIILFVYNRPEHTKQTLKFLKKNKLAEESKLYIFSDGAKNEPDKDKIKEVREVINSVEGFKDIQILERENNLGLAKSVRSGIDEVLQNHDKIIVMEDDIICSTDFISYMNELLNYYESYEKIFSISGYTFPIKIPYTYKHDLYFSPRASSWGWGTWKSRWEKIDWEVKDFEDFINNKSSTFAFEKGGYDLTKMLKNLKEGKIDSWAIIWSYTHFKNNAYCVYPVKSRIKNTGTDLSGVHSNRTNQFDVDLNTDIKAVTPVENPEMDETIMKNFKNFFRKRIINSIYNKIIRLKVL